jgi:aspartate aminotransferase
MVNSPSNPSGAVVDRDEFRRIYELTSRRGIWLITDECYHRFLYESEPFSITAEPRAQDSVIVAGSLSKTYAMTGWRIGFALAPPPIISAILKLQSHSTSNPTSIAQRAALEAVRGPQDSVVAMLAEYRKRRDYVIDRLRAIDGFHVNMPQGAFYAYPNVSGCFRPGGVRSGMEFAEKLLSEKAVAVVPGEAFGTNEHVRISYATSMTELERGLDRIAEFAAQLRA